MRQRSNNQRDLHGDTTQTRRFPGISSSQVTYKRKQEFVRDWMSSVVGQTFVEDDTLVSESQKSQTFDVSSIDDDSFSY
jgi:hypothetical protein